MKKENLNLLNNLEVIRWCYENSTSVKRENFKTQKLFKEAQKKEEVSWGNSVIGTTKSKQWTTKLCENLVREGLIQLGRKNVTVTTKKKSSIRNKKYDPDLECDEYVYEVKGRSWNTSGTAGEKILGVPLKYGELPRLYHKPLQIILVGYQEFEAKKGFAFGDLLDKNNQTKELQDSLAFYKEQGIEYVGFTDILEKIGYPKGCWKK